MSEPITFESFADLRLAQLAEWKAKEAQSVAESLEGIGRYTLLERSQSSMGAMAEEELWKTAKQAGLQRGIGVANRWLVNRSGHSNEGHRLLADVKREAAIEVVGEWLSGGWLTPDHLAYFVGGIQRVDHFSSQEG